MNTMQKKVVKIEDGQYHAILRAIFFEVQRYTSSCHECGNEIEELVPKVSFIFKLDNGGFVRKRFLIISGDDYKALNETLTMFGVNDISYIHPSGKRIEIDPVDVIAFIVDGEVESWQVSE